MCHLGGVDGELLYNATFSHVDGIFAGCAFIGDGEKDAGTQSFDVVGLATFAEVLEVVDKWDPQAFVTVEEPKVLRGGGAGAIIELIAETARSAKVNLFRRYELMRRWRTGPVPGARLV